jgi:tetratricopeptide (TPR) repeat protein/transglutaminase-like putative cysteine protease
MRRIRTLAAALLAALAGLVPALAQSFEESWRTEAERTRRLRGEAASLRPLHRLADSARLARDPREVERALEELASLDGWDPNGRAALLHRLRGQALDGGRLERAAELSRELGTLESYLVIGPFGNTNRQGHETAYPPERQVEPDRRESGVSGAVEWRPLQAGPDGTLALDQAFFPFTKVTAYALALVWSEGEKDAALRFGGDDQLKAWHGEGLLWEDSAAHPARFDQHVVGLRLQPGWNRILFKVSQDEGAWRLTARLTAPEGGALEGVRAAEAGELREALARSENAAPPDGETDVVVSDPAVDLWRRVFGDEEDAGAAADLAAHLTRTHPFDRSLEPDTEQARRAVHLEADRPDFYLVLRDSLRDVDHRRRALEAGVDRAPADVRLRYLLALHYRNSHRPERALEELERIVSLDPGFVVARAERLAVLADLEVPGPSLAGLEALALEHPETPLVRYHLSDLHATRGRDRRAEEELSAYRLFDARNDAVYEQMANLLGRRGDVEGLLALHREAVLLNPLRLTPRLNLARTLEGVGRGEEALETLDEALAICPGQPELLRYRAEYLLLQGRDEEAIADLEAALVSRPGDEGLVERLELLAGASAGFETPYQIDAEGLRRLGGEAAPSEGPAATLLDTTVVRLLPGGASATFRQELTLVRRAEEAGELGTYRILHSPHSERLRVKEARILRADGSVIRAVQRETSYLADPEVRIYYDTRARVIYYPELEDGDLIELSYVLQDLDFSGGPRDDFGLVQPLAGPYPREGTRVVVLAPAGETLGHRVHGLDSAPEPLESREGEERRLEFRFGAAPALLAEPGAPPEVESVPLLLLSSAESWRELGRWYAELIRDSLESDQDIRRTVEELTAGLDDPRAKTEAIYRWVIDRTRYVGLEFGVHRIKPYRVGRTFQRRHGDCKDKAALLVTMLREAGVEGHLALVRTRYAGRVPTDLPSLALFDHVIVRVPSLDLWLDGTVYAHGAEELPWQDRDMPALVIGPEGGTLLTTPAARAETNRTLWDTETELVLDGGQVTVRGSVETTGEAAAGFRERFRQVASPDGVLRSLLQSWFPGAELLDFELRSTELTEPRPGLSYEARLSNPVQGEGDRRSMPMLLDAPLLGTRHSLSERSSDLVLGPPATEEWSHRWILPPGTRPGELPEAVRIESPYGHLEIETGWRPEPDPERRRLDRSGTLTVRARRVLSVDQISAESMEAFRRFCRESDAALSRHLALEVAR